MSISNQLWSDELSEIPSHAQTHTLCDPLWGPLESHAGGAQSLVSRTGEFPEPFPSPEVLKEKRWLQTKESCFCPVQALPSGEESSDGNWQKARICPSPGLGPDTHQPPRFICPPQPPHSFRVCVCVCVCVCWRTDAAAVMNTHTQGQGEQASGSATVFFLLQTAWVRSSHTL